MTKRLVKRLDTLRVVAQLPSPPQARAERAPRTAETVAAADPPGP